MVTCCLLGILSSLSIVEFDLQEAVCVSSCELRHLETRDHMSAWAL